MVQKGDGVYMSDHTINPNDREWIVTHILCKHPEWGIPYDAPNMFEKVDQLKQKIKQKKDQEILRLFREIYN